MSVSLSDTAPVPLIPEFLLCILGKVVKPALIVFPETVTEIGLVEVLLPPTNLPQENLPDIPEVEIPDNVLSVATPAMKEAVFELVCKELIMYTLSKNDVPIPTGAPVDVITEVAPDPTAVSYMNTGSPLVNPLNVPDSFSKKNFIVELPP